VRFLSRFNTGDLDGEDLDNRDSTRGLIDQGEPLAEQEQYRDDVDDAPQGIVNSDNANINRLRVEPPGLPAGNSNEQWRNNM